MEIKTEIKMEIKTVNELGYTELIIEANKVYEEGYQMSMLRECKIPGLLSVIACGVDDRSQYIYDVSGMQSLSKAYEKLPMDEYSIRAFSKQLLEVLESIKHHMLDVNCILLDPDYIYKEKDTYFFTYYPLSTKVIAHSFHEISQYFVQHIDYGEVETVILACGLHKATMEEDYDLAQLLQSHSVMESEEVQKEVEKEIVHEAIEARERNKESLWESAPAHIDRVAETSLRKLWNIEKLSPASKEREEKAAQKKKQAWGDWDALLKKEGYR